MAGGLFGTGICFSQDCKDRMNAEAEADAQLKQAQAAALLALGQKPESKGLSGGTIAIIIIIVLLIIVGGYFLFRKRK